MLFAFIVHYKSLAHAVQLVLTLNIDFVVVYTIRYYGMGVENLCIGNTSMNGFRRAAPHIPIC